MAVFAPMPRASESTTTVVKPELLASIRKPKRKSCRNASMISSFDYQLLHVSSTTGVGMYYLANSQATLNAKIQNNTVAAPTDVGVARPAIRVDSGTAPSPTAVDTTVCAN